ncbi:hypothetical protein TNCT_540911 [Trichonephila clavata]|uniref:Uncharacterized protein n=1 Tax=Trichonephila clavata TaxID=2740835 RepID=A0A8X6HUA5_TRICU|nr:hypothetical protein TNCT_540911 [Trichonephila clavata]
MIVKRQADKLQTIYLNLYILNVKVKKETLLDTIPESGQLRVASASKDHCKECQEPARERDKTNGFQVFINNLALRRHEILDRPGGVVE